MAAVPLFTSLPPALAAGRDYQRACVHSWKQAGFNPVSVNSRREVEANPGLRALAHELGVELVLVERDAQRHTGRPHVFLADLLGAACERAVAGLAIANADILLRAADLASRVARLDAGQVLLARRTDVSDARAGSGARYAHGFDFFALRADDARPVPDIGLIVGAPWWDHYLPILLRTRGARVEEIAESAAFHLVHDERWDWQVWRTLGQRFLKAMHAVLRSASYAEHPAARAYVALMEQAAGPAPRFWRPRASDASLRKLSDANMAFLTG